MRRFLVLLAFLVPILNGCGAKKLPPYSPHENLLSIATEFELLASRDPYREEAAEELTGQSIARATVARLDNYERLYPSRYVPEVAFLKARALELLGDYAEAQSLYARVAGLNVGALSEDAHARAAILDEMITIRRLADRPGSLEGALDAFQRQAIAFSALGRRPDLPSPYARLALRETEQAEVTRAELLANHRWVLPDGEAQALQALRGLVEDHRTSSRSLEHALRLASFHRALAEEEARLNPPDQANFDSDRFFRNIDQARELLYRVSQADGQPERLIARHELDAVIALEEITRDRAD